MEDKRLPVQKLFALQPDELNVYITSVCDGSGKVAKALREKLVDLELVDYDEKKDRCRRSPNVSLVDYFDAKDVCLRALEDDARQKLRNARLGR